MARLQELQFTVEGGTKVISGVSLSPRSTRGYLRTSLRCKQESMRIKNATPNKSPVGKFKGSTGGEWQRMSLPAMLVNETVGEILQASQFAREIVAAVTKKKTTLDDPKTPMTTKQRKQRLHNLEENSELRARRKREKQITLQSIRTDSNTSSLQRAKSRINFKVSPPRKIEIEREREKENSRYIANRVSPRNKPWAKKTVLFPNPLFISTPSSQQHKFCKTRSPVIARNRLSTPHKFLIKSPPSNSKFQVKIKSPTVSISPTRRANNISLSKNSPKMSTASKLRRSFSPSKLRRSFSPSKLANRLVSPLKSRKVVQRSDGLMMMTGLKQRPSSTTPLQFSVRRI